MPATQPERRDGPATEPSSWRPLVAIALGAVGVYGVLAVVLILEATSSGPSGSILLAVPGLLFCAAVAAFFLSLTPIRNRLAAFGAWFVGESPRDVFVRQPSPSSRDRA
jgi:hypothetical protein